MRRMGWMLGLWIGLGLFPAMAAATPERDVFSDTFRGAMVGGMTGLMLGMHHYGLSRNLRSDLISVHAAYGLATGALLGTGLGLVERLGGPSQHTDRYANYALLGAVGGSLTGVFYATIPWALSGEEDERNFYQGSVGFGLGGMIGALAGIVVAACTLPPESGGEQTWRMGLQPETALLVPPVSHPDPCVGYRVVEVTF